MSSAPTESPRRALLETIGTRGASLFLNLLAQILATRFLGVEGKGQFGAAITLANGLSIIGTWGLGPVLLNRALALGPEARKRLRQSVFTLRLILGIGAGLLGAGLWANYTHGWSESLALVFLVACSAHENLWQFQVCGRTGDAYRLMALQGLLNLLGFMILPFVPGSPVWCAVLTQALSSLITRLIAHRWLKVSYLGSEPSGSHPPRTAELIASTRWNVVAGLVAFGKGYSDTLICLVLLGVAETGYLSTAQMGIIAPMSLVQVVAVLAQANWARQRAARGNAETARSALRQSRRWALGTILACPALSIASWFGLPLVMGSAYAPAGPVLAIWVLVLPFEAANLHLLSFLQVAEQFKPVFKLNIVLCAISMIGNILLMPVWGLWTAVFTSFLTSALTVWFTTRKVSQLAVSD